MERTDIGSCCLTSTCASRHIHSHSHDTKQIKYLKKKKGCKKKKRYLNRHGWSLQILWIKREDMHRFLTQHLPIRTMEFQDTLLTLKDKDFAVRQTCAMH